MFLDRFDKKLGAGDLDGFEFVANLDALFGGGSARAAVGDQAFGIDGAKVAPDGDIVSADGKVDPKGFKDAAAYAPFQRVIAEQGEMAWTASWGDTGQDGGGEAANAIPNEVV